MSDKLSKMISNASTVQKFIMVGLFFLSVSAMAGQYGDFTYSDNGTGITITDYTGTGGDVTIPDTIDGKPVTAIGDSAFDNNPKLINVTNVVIPNTVTSIGVSAFEQCEILNSITIPDSVTSIGSYAFASCRLLSNVKMGSGLTTIENSVFSCCLSLSNIVIPHGVTSINDYAFSSTGLTSINIPSNVINIGKFSFSGCSNLSIISVSPDNPIYCSEDGVLFNKDKTTLIQYPSGIKNTNYSIPSSVTSIQNNAFSNCPSLTNIAIPNGVTSIGESAFATCVSLKSIVIPSGLTKIENSTFVSCSSLSNITIPNNITNIGNGAFGYCASLNKITIPASVASIGDWAFEYGTNLTNAYFLGSAPTMGKKVFANCASGFTVNYISGAIGFTQPKWRGYPSATFDNQNYSLTFAVNPVPSGTTNPDGTITVSSSTTQNIIAIPANGYGFISWIATPAANAIIADANAAMTSVALTGDCVLTANYIETPTAQLTTVVAPINTGTITPTGTITVTSGRTQVITSSANDGYSFAKWSADNEQAIFGDIFSINTTVTIFNDSIITANFIKTPNYLTYGMLYKMVAKDIGQDNFPKAPKVYATYADPISGSSKKTALKVITKVTSPVDAVDSEWEGQIMLFNKKLWNKAKTYEENLATNPIEPLPTKLFASNIETSIVLTLVPPSINGVYMYGNAIVSAKADDVIFVKGKYFGSKTPFIGLEYPVYQKDGKTIKEIKFLSLKVVGSLSYPDAKGTPCQSCTNIYTGDSEFQVLMPSKWPKGWDHNVSHNIVIDNKIGKATVQFKTEE